jgi:hypothetical protein
MLKDFQVKYLTAEAWFKLNENKTRNLYFVMTIKELLNYYKAGHDDLQNALKELPMEMWDFKPAPEKWSIREIIVHVTDSEANGYVRCRKIVAENGSEVTAYDQDAWAENLLYASRSIDSNLELFKIFRIINYTLLNDLPEEKWNNYLKHPEYGKMTLYDHVKLYADHVYGHINQMKRNLEDWKKFVNAAPDN